MAEQMTLEQVRDWLIGKENAYRCYQKWSVNLDENKVHQFRKAIEAHLNAAKGEVVAWWCAIESVEAIDGTEEIAMSWNADDGNAGEAARTEANQWINDQPHPGNFHLAKVYTNPASPDVVRDAERYRWLREHGNKFFNAMRYQGRFDVMDQSVDAAMAAREGGE